MSTMNYILGRPDDDDPRKKALLVQPVNGALQMGGARIGAVPYEANMGGGGAATVSQQSGTPVAQPQQGQSGTTATPAQQNPQPQPPQAQGGLVNNFIAPWNAYKSQKEQVQQAIQGVPQKAYPTFDLNQVEAMENSPNVATLPGKRPMAQWARNVFYPDGVTGSPTTSADEQVARLNKNGIQANGIPSAQQPEGGLRNGKKQTGAQPAQQGNTPGLDLSNLDMQKVIDFLQTRAGDIETPEQRKAREKKERQKKMWGAISDGISALSNLYFSNKGAPIQYDPTQTMTGKAQERFDQLMKEREKRKDDYLTHYMRLLAEKRARESAAAQQAYYDSLSKYREAQGNAAEQNANTRQEVGKSQVAKNEADTRRSNAQTAYTNDRREHPEKYKSSGKSGGKTSSGKSGGKKSSRSSSARPGRSSSRSSSGGGASSGSGKPRLF